MADNLSEMLTKMSADGPEVARQSVLHQFPGEDPIQGNFVCMREWVAQWQ